MVQCSTRGRITCNSSPIQFFVFPLPGGSNRDRARIGGHSPGASDCGPDGAFLTFQGFEMLLNASDVSCSCSTAH